MIQIRPARESEQKEIERIVRAAHINPMDLDWRRFAVAEEDGRIIGVGQVKPHRDGSRELASIAVIPGRHGQGIGSEIIRALLSKESATLYLMCRNGLETYYARFGFRRLKPDEMTPYFRKMHRLANSFLARKIGVQIIVMKRDAANSWVAAPCA